MGQPGGIFPSLPTEYIGRREQTQGSETSQYLQEKKSNEIPSVVASERGLAQTKEHALRGCRAVHSEVKKVLDSRIGMERPTIEGNSPVGEI